MIEPSRFVGNTALDHDQDCTHHAFVLLVDRVAMIHKSTNDLGIRKGNNHFDRAGTLFGRGGWKGHSISQAIFVLGRRLVNLVPATSTLLLGSNGGTALLVFGRCRGVFFYRSACGHARLCARLTFAPQLAAAAKVRET
jgi:hypothetical protein